MVRPLLSVLIALGVTACAPVAPTALLAVAEPEAEAVQRPSGQTLEQAEDGLFYADAHVNGTPLRFVVDTGASVVVLTAADARVLGIATADLPQRRVDTAAGGANMPRVMLDKVALGSRTLTDVEAVVMPRGLKVSLLGQNVLARMERVTISQRRLRID